MTQFRRTYARPYQFYKELRLYAVYRSAEHTIFVGSGFADNCFAFLEKQYDKNNNSIGKLIKLDQQDVKRGEYDQLITGPIKDEYPYRLFIVNPDDEGGKASNAVEFEMYKQIPLLDVKVNGKSVVQNQIAYIDLTSKIDAIRKPNKLYGTDSDGRTVVYDKSQIEGIQHVILNARELDNTDHTVHLEDIAYQSKTVPIVHAKEILYGTNKQGEQSTYPVGLFASSSEVNIAIENLGNLAGKLDAKQDKDNSAASGIIGVFNGNGSTVSSGRTIQSIDDNINSASTKAENAKSTADTNTEKIRELEKKLKEANEKTLEKLKGVGQVDWKAIKPENSIINNPVNANINNITITTKPIAEEQNQLRNKSNAIAIGFSDTQVTDNSIAIGSSNAVAGGIAIGSSNKTEKGIVIGKGITSTNDNIAIGNFITFSKDVFSSVGIGNGSTPTESNTVSVGDKATQYYRRICNVADPVNNQDAVTKQYVDAKVAGGGNTAALQQEVEKLKGIVNTLASALLDKVYGGGTYDKDTGKLTFNTPGHIAVGDLNIYSNGGDGNETANAIRTRSGDSNGDIRIM